MVVSASIRWRQANITLTGVKTFSLSKSLAFALFSSYARAFSAAYGWWNEQLRSERAFVTAL
jgi:hypothetical protein